MSNTVTYSLVPGPGGSTVVVPYCGTTPTNGDVACGISVQCGQVNVGWRCGLCQPGSVDYVPALAGWHQIRDTSGLANSGSGVSNTIASPGPGEQTLPFTVTAPNFDDDGNCPSPLAGSIVVDI